MENDNERWKIDGDCSKCRRQKYCSKRCKKYTESLNNDITKIILEKTGMGKMLELMSSLRGGRYD